jgi:hypothetical protein
MLYFNQVEKAMKQLTQAGIQSDLKEQTDMALYFLKYSGEIDAVAKEWESKPTALKTWANIKTFISTEYSTANKQNKLTAEQFKANVVEEQAEATEELIAQLPEAHTHQMETLIKSTTEAMKEMLNLMKIRNTRTNTPNSDSEDKKKICKDKQIKYCDVPICKHCDKKSSIQNLRQVLGTPKECSIMPSILEIKEKHLKVHRATIRNRNIATGKSTTQ